jgi:ribose/xylose/arabinose/galactoside ABC-type transport system permease subunit
MTQKTMKKRFTSGVKRMNGLLNSMGVWLVVLLFIIILTITTDTFFTYANLINVIRQICVNALVALGTAYVILGGEIDLSTGYLTALAGCGAALLMRAGVNMWVAIGLMVLAGAIVGGITGTIVTMLNIPSFITSLGMGYVILGTTLLLTNSEPISGLPDNFMLIGRGYIWNVIPIPVVILVVFFTIGAFVLKYTSFGRNVISVGENPVAARLSGINVIKTKILIFAIGGFSAAAAGIVLASRLSSGQPMAGSDLGLTSIAAVFVGGTDKGSALNVLAGAFVLGLVNNGLNLLEVSAYWQKVALGMIIISAVLLDQLRARRSISHN